MPELNDTATRKAPEAELAESVAECVRLTKQTVSDIRAIRRAYAVETYSPLHGDPIRVQVNEKALSHVLARYRELCPLDNRAFEDMSSDIQHAIIKASKGGRL